MTATHGSNSIAADQVRSYVERKERLNEEIKTLQDDKKVLNGEIKSNGYNPKMIERLVKIRAEDPEKRDLEQMELDTYLSALGMQPKFDFEGEIK